MSGFRRGQSSSSSSFIDPADLSLDGSLQGGPAESISMHGYGRMSQEDESAGFGPSVLNGSSRDGYAALESEGSGGGAAKDSSLYGSFTGYCFTVNYILGVGVLGMPYAFYRGGWALSTLLLGFVTIMASYSALWLVDVSLRAQYIKRQETLLHNSAAPGAALEINQAAPLSDTHQSRYEMNELVELFMGVKARRFYELLVIIYLVGALWSYTSVFASSLASHFPLPGINGGNECDIYKDFSSSCTDLYLTYTGIFALICIPLTCLDLTEMKLMQIVLAIFRFVSLGTMMLTSLVAIFTYPNDDPDARSPAEKPYVSEGVVAFNWNNIGLVFPIAIYSQIFHHSVPGLLHPLKRKPEAPRVFTGVLATTMMLYVGLGITVSLFYGGSIPQTCTLAWAHYKGSSTDGTPGWAAAIGYMIVLFPPIDIVSAFPLNAITLGNNLLCAFVKDERKQALRRYKLPFRLLAATPPVLGAMLVKDLSTILKYTGCVGVLLAFMFPCFLQWQSKRKCEQMGLLMPSQALSVVEARNPALSADTLAPPSYSGKWINNDTATWVVLAFSSIGLVAVIVLSILGLSD